jgi:hypothetical protein
VQHSLRLQVSMNVFTMLKIHSPYARSFCPPYSTSYMLFSYTISKGLHAHLPAIHPPRVALNHVVVSMKGTNLSQGPKTFSIFPKLPRELHGEVWRLAALEPQKIKLCTNNNTEKEEKRSNRIPRQRKTPSILHACKESRGESLR